MSVLALLALSQPAAACGGFFCNNTEPVDQAAERILFVHDEEAGEVEAHVQIFFTGSADEFAWVVPVPAVPELFTSSDAVFSMLENVTRPTFQLVYEEVGECVDNRVWLDASYSTYNLPSIDEDEGGVDIIDEMKVGPYETVTLRARSTDELLTWLQDNGFDLPDALSPALDPYVAEESYFVAMRLANDASSSDIEPIGMRYPSDSISIPIQLTSIAATPDMRVEAYVLGGHRAVPESYLHVQINEAAIDWFGGGWNYEEVITQAANEAGGHAFATDYSGPASIMANAVDLDRYDTASIAAATEPVVAMSLVTAQFAATPLLLTILTEFMPPPGGVDAQDFYNCVGCYSLPADYAWDPVGLAEALEERIVEPLAHVDGLFEAHPHLTRLTSSLDAVEMTVDPTFVFNSDMRQTVEHDHEAKVLMHCGDGGEWFEASRELVFEDGRSIRLPSEAWLAEMGMTEFEFMERLSNKAALVIEQTAASGEPIVIADYNTWADAQAHALSTEADAIAGDGAEVEAKGCGCDATGAGGAAGLLAVAGLLGLRRRR